MPPIVNNAILDFGLRGALFGASIGGVVGLTKGFFGERRKMAMNGALQRHLRQYEFIKYDPELLTSIVEIGGKYRKFSAKAFSKIANGCNRMVSVNAQLMSGRLPAKPSTPRLISLAASEAVEGIRTLRAAFSAACPGNPSELETFDELASAIQTACNNYQHNVSMHVQTQL